MGVAGESLQEYRRCLQCSGGDLAKLDATITSAWEYNYMRNSGIRMSRRAFELAASGEIATRKPRGRKSKVDDPAMVKLVVDAVNEFSQESSIWIPELERHAKILQDSWLGIYWKRAASKMAWTQYWKITCTHCQWAQKARRGTDYCDHCWLYKHSIMPGLVRSIKEGKASLESHCSWYFEDWDDKLSTTATTDMTPVAESFVTFVRQHVNRYAHKRRRVGVSLRHAEGKVLKQLEWEVRVAKAYEWHRQGADRQLANFSNEVARLADGPDGHAVLVVDYKQNPSIPLATMSLNTMYYGTDRMEMVCFGACLWYKSGGRVVHKKIALVSSIINKDCMMSALCFETLRKYYPEHVSLISVWSDCGPHFRAKEHIGFLSKWQGQVACPLRVNFFVEKHGKGAVDTFFAEVNSWLEAFLNAGENQRIATIEEFVNVLKAGAQRCNDRDPNGTRYFAERLESTLRPVSVSTLSWSAFKLRSTYCMQLTRFPGGKRGPRAADFVYADLCSGRPKTLEAIVLTEVVVKDRNWRRGYFGTKRWDREIPTTRDEVVSRFETHLELGVNAAVMPLTRWERSQVSRTRRLLVRRTKWKRWLEHARGGQQGSEGSDDSDSSSSSTTTSESS